MTYPINTNHHISYYVPENQLTKEVRKLNSNGWYVHHATMDDPVKRLFFIHAEYIGSAIKEGNSED